MNQIQRIIRRLIGITDVAAIKQSKTTPAFLPMAERSFLGLADMDMTASTLHKYYQSWFYAGASLRAEEVAAIDLRLFETQSNGEIEEIDDHESLSVIKSVNAMATQYDLFYALQTYKDIYGEAFWWILRDGNRPVGIYPWLNPSRMGIEISQDGNIEKYIYQVPGNRDFISFKPDEIIHFKRFNPKDPYRGLSLIRAAQYAIANEAEAQNWNFKFFKNSAQPSGVISFPTRLDKDQQEILRAQWDRIHQGTEKAHRIAILTHDGKFTQVGLSQKDMDFLEQQRFSRDQILTILRTPLAVLNPDESINRATAEAAQSFFFERVVKPQMMQIVATLNEFFLPMFGDVGKLFFDFWNVGPKNFEADLRYYEVGINTGSLSPNEIRQLEGRDPIEGGDEYFLPFNLQPVGTGPTQLAVRQQMLKSRLHVRRKKTLAERIYPEAKEIATILSKKAKVLAEEKKIKREEISDPSKDARQRIGEGFVQIAKARSSQEEILFRRKLKKEFDRQERQVLASLNEKAVGFEFDEDEEAELFGKIFLPVVRDIVRTHGEDALQLLGERGFVISDAVREYLKIHGLEFAKGIQDTTKEKIKTAIQSGVDADEGIPQIRKRIQGVFSEASTSRAQMIARTEVARSSNFGITEGYIQSDVVEKKEWYTPLGEDIEICVQMQGTIIGLRESFDLPNGDSVSDPPAHPNCVCRTLPVVSEKKMIERPIIIESKIIDEEITDELKRIAEEGNEQISGLKRIREKLEKESEAEERNEQISSIRKTQ